MRECFSCRIFYQESARICSRCQEQLQEVTLSQALEHTRNKFLNRFSRQAKVKNLNSHAHYVISSYFGNHSLFLFFDLNKNHMKYGPYFERFFIQPLNMTFVFNLPWFFFNVLYSNYFHIHYKDFCHRCYCKHPKGYHTTQECDYNIEYFYILRDVLNGSIVRTKKVYERLLVDDLKSGKKNPYADLYKRPIKLEVFFDLISISFSIFLWLYFTAYISFPMVKVLAQILQIPDAYEWRF